MHTYQLDDVSEDMSFLEMLDVLNEQLNAEGEEPIAFDSDCREGICGMCGLMINGEAHGPEVTTTCQLHMRSFSDGDDDHHRAVARRRRSRCSRTSSSTAAPSTGSSRPGGYISVNTGAAPDAHATPVPKDNADRAFDVATCIGCGACVAACPNGSASLFLGAKITHLGELPQGQAERDSRVVDMVAQHDARGLRRLHQHRRVHRGLPQGDPARRDLPAQQGPARRHPPRSLTPLAPTDKDRRRPPRGRPAPGRRPGRQRGLGRPRRPAAPTRRAGRCAQDPTLHQASATAMARSTTISTVWRHRVAGRAGAHRTRARPRGSWRRSAR